MQLRSRNILTIVFFLTFSFFSNISNAGLLIEPLVGYNLLGQMSQDPNFEWEYDGSLYGGRLGWQFAGLMVGATYEISSFELVQTAPDGVTTAANLKLDHKAQYIGAFVGFNFPLLLRIWGTYYLTTEFEQDEGTAVGDTFSGSGYGLGVGYTGLPFLSINLEYRTHELDTWNDASANTESSLANTKEVTEIVLGVSLPLTLF